MVDFRKWLIGLAGVAVLIALGAPANAQNGVGTAFTCTAQAGDPHIIRIEGITELIGDIVITCFGGNPTPAGAVIPQSNITLTLNTNITSRLLSGGYIDALLLIDEPITTSAATQNPQPPGGAFTPFTVGRPVTSPPQSVCFANQSSSSTQPSAINPLVGCNIVFGTYNGISPGLPGAAPSPYQTQANIFVARSTSANNQINWLGVPIDAPGTNAQRVIRITDVRANACQLMLSATLIPTQVVAFIAVNGSQNLTLNNPQQTVAFIQQGLIVAGQNTSLQQCNNLNVGGGGVGGNFFGGSGVGNAVTNVNVREGFAASFKRHAVAAIGVTSIPPGNAAEGIQNVVGFAYNTEAGFDPQGTNPIGTHFGQADAATRIFLRFNNIAPGVQILVPTIVALTLDNPNLPGTPDILSSGLSTWTGGFLQLRSGAIGQADGNLPTPFGFAVGTGTATFSGSSFFFSSPPFKGIGALPPFITANSLPVIGGSAVALYEVVNADPHAVEQANIPVGVAFTSGTGIPATGQSTVNVSFAPLSNVNTFDFTAPIPRFCDRSVPQNTFHIDACQCNLLFPFITNQSGFDTGIAIANTTTDPYGTTPQNGLVTLYFYGTGPITCTFPKLVTTSPVLSGTELIFTLSSGGNYGIPANAGCQGYMFAIANFQYCHAFAFISDVGAQKLAEGYLAIQIDIYGGTGLNRTGITGEVQGH